jgi:peptidylprolyl isomerase
VPIVSVRLGSELPDADPASSSQAVGQTTRPRFEYLASDSESFADYVHVRANRSDAFYRVPAGGVDVCNVQVPIRRVEE